MAICWKCKIKTGRETPGAASHLVFPHCQRGSTSLYLWYWCWIYEGTAETWRVRVSLLFSFLASFACYLPLKLYCFLAEWDGVRIRSNIFTYKTIFSLWKGGVSHYFTKQTDVPVGGVYGLVIVRGIVGLTAGFVQRMLWCDCFVWLWDTEREGEAHLDTSVYGQK